MEKKQSGFGMDDLIMFLASSVGLRWKNGWRTRVLW